MWLIRTPQPPHPELDPVARQLLPPFDLGHVGGSRPLAQEAPRPLPGLFSGQCEGLPDVAIVGRLRLATLKEALSQVLRGFVGHRDTQLRRGG